jgi:hypothetical protein
MPPNDLLRPSYWKQPGIRLLRPTAPGTPAMAGGGVEAAGLAGVWPFEVGWSGWPPTTENRISGLERAV